MRIARMFLWVSSGEAVSRVAVLATSLIAVRALTPVEFGLYLGLLATMVLSASLWDVGVSVVVTRELAADRLSTRDAVIQSAFLRVRTFPIWAIAIATGGVMIGGGGGIPGSVYLVFGAASLTFSVHTLALAILTARLRFKLSTGSSAVGRWVTAGSSVAALPPLTLGDPLLVLACAVLAGEITTLAIAVAAIVVDSRSRVVARDVRHPESRLTLRSSLPFAANGILNLAYNRFDVVILAGLSSSAQLALYAPASRMQDAFHLIPAGLSVVGLPLISRAWGSGDGLRETRAIMKQLMTLGLLLALPAAVLTFVYTPEIIGFVLGDEYLGAVRATRILIWSLPFSVLTSVLIASLAGTGRALDTTRVFALAFMVAAVMHLSLDWWLGATGAAVASLSREPAALLAAGFFARNAGLVAKRRSRGGGASYEVGE